MLRVLFLMLVLLAGLIAGPYLAGKQGYVLIETASYSIEMSLTTLVIFFVIALGVIYLIEWVVTRFLRLSSNTYSWFARRKRKKAQKQTLEGLMRMDAGDYSKAEKLIGKNAKHSEEPILNFIKAAEAAQQRGDEFSANKYLIEATELAGSDNLALEIARTRIMMQQNKLPAARSSVDSLLVMAPRNPEVLKLATEIYLQSKAYQSLDDLLDKIERSDLYSGEAFTTLEHQVVDGLLDEKMNEEGQDGLLDWWHNQSRQRRHNLYVKIGLIRRLIDCNDHESAYELTLEAVKKVQDGSDEARELFAQITRLQPMDSSKLIKLLEKRIHNMSQDKPKCEIHRALGYLYARNAEFEKASEVFKQVIAVTHCANENDATMAAYVFEQVNDMAAVQQVREQSLKNAMDTQTIKTADTAENSEKTTALLPQK
ncbi:heme biosynthesis protein HemY [Conservatibacter flavescens]|uniref:Heme biosynthesis protein HemY n=1 Tax=Conservatibacter flavescens TaxID=28161 RepID=A0A2M8S315_9PAST|nr:heme biosynthesis protein HemY [Conservatibacter flavescens]PJG85526.1 heme biosynthesis protein HemY [Conservatibacter flavescens]